MTTLTEGVKRAARSAACEGEVRAVDGKRSSRFARRTRWALTGGVALISIGVLTFNAAATFTAQVSPTHATSTGDMEFTLGSAGASHRIATASTNIVPGDYISRTIQIDVSNVGGTMTGATLTTSGSGNPTLVSTATASGGLGLLLTACDQAWTEGGSNPAYTYTCGGSTTNIVGTYNATLSSATFSNFVQSATSLTGFDISNGATNYLLAVMKFPSNGPDSMESQSTTLTFQFDGVQRAGTNK